MIRSGPPWEVIHCVFSVGIGGQEIVILSLAEHADRARFIPRVLCLQEAGTLAPRFEAAGVPVDVLDCPAGAGSWRAFRALRRYLRAHRPAILHTHNPTPHRYGALARVGAGIPVLVHTKHGRNQTLSAREQWFERVSGRLTDAVVAVSNDAANVARSMDRVPADRLRVIHNGVDFTTIAPRGDAAPTWRVVHVARLNAVKDQPTLLRAARLVADRDPRFRLEIVGDGELRDELERLRTQLSLNEVVTFHGYHADVRPFLQRADAFVLSSVSEGIALTLLEAMAAALPVVATDVGGNREVVVPDETGLLVPAATAEALAEALWTVLSRPGLARQMGIAGRARVTREFSLHHTVDAYQALYDELLRQRIAGKVAA